MSKAKTTKVTTLAGGKDRGFTDAARFPLLQVHNVEGQTIFTWKA